MSFHAKLQKYKRKEKEIIAWLLVALARMQVEEDKPTITIVHFNPDFLRRFKQLVRLGKLGTIDYMRAKWQLTELSEILFLLQQVAPYMRCQRQKHIAHLMIQYCQKPTSRIAGKIQKINRKQYVKTSNDDYW